PDSAAAMMPAAAMMRKVSVARTCDNHQRQGFWVPACAGMTMIVAPVYNSVPLRISNATLK
ncbi:MAG: hypothetical protein WBA37_07685, partial [Xanthobacteraceae bacterium]